MITSEEVNDDVIARARDSYNSVTDGISTKTLAIVKEDDTTVLWCAADER